MPKDGLLNQVPLVTETYHNIVRTACSPPFYGLKKLEEEQLQCRKERKCFLYVEMIDGVFCEINGFYSTRRWILANENGTQNYRT